jgi:glycosyltransferase involved in cell wall biosynthesis
MTRVLVIEPSGNLWGSERALLDVLDGIGTTDAAVCCPPGMPLEPELKKRGLRAYTYFIYALHQKSRWARLRAAVGVLRACLEFRPDVIYLNQSGTYKVVLPAATLLRLPIVAHVRIFEDAQYLARQRPDPRRLRGVIAISAAIEAEIRKFRELDDIALHRHYDAYASFAGPDAGRSIERVPNRIACVGRLVPVKGHGVLIGALGALKNRGRDVECLIAGDGEAPFVQRLRVAADDADAATSIQWMGFVKDVVPLLRTCTVSVCPSLREPLGRVIFEAWEAGAVPIAYAGSGGAAEVIKASNGGILYDEQDAESLANALEAALNLDDDRAARLIANGREWMAKNCDPRAYGAAVSAILTSAAHA